MSPARLTKLIAAIGVTFLTACAADSASAPSMTRAAGAPARDAEPCGGYSVADGRCETLPSPAATPDTTSAPTG